MTGHLGLCGMLMQGRLERHKVATGGNVQSLLLAGLVALTHAGVTVAAATLLTVMMSACCRLMMT